MTHDKPGLRRQRLIAWMEDGAAALQLAGFSYDDAWRIVLEEGIRKVDAAYGLTAARRDAGGPALPNPLHGGAAANTTNKPHQAPRQIPPDTGPVWGWSDGEWTVIEPEHERQ